MPVFSIVSFLSPLIAAMRALTQAHSIAQGSRAQRAWTTCKPPFSNQPHLPFGSIALASSLLLPLTFLRTKRADGFIQRMRAFPHLMG